MLVGEVENNNFSPLALAGKCVTNIWKHRDHLIAQSFQYVAKTEVLLSFVPEKMSVCG